MFDIGFSELFLVMIVGLIVLGPQRMPVAIRTVMGWVRTLRSLATNVQQELSQELKLQELKESIKKAEDLNLKSLSPELSKTVEELKQSAQKMQQELSQNSTELEASIRNAHEKVQQAVEQDLAQAKDAFAVSPSTAPESEQTKNSQTENSQTENSKASEKAPKKEENHTALSPNPIPEDDQAELAEQDELLAKYIDQYHPDEPELTPAKSANTGKKHNL